MTGRRDANLGYFNRAAASRHPDRIAVVDLSRSPAAEISHGALDRRMDRVAAALTERGLVPGDRVLLAMANRFEFIETFFGAMRAGLVPVPLNIRLGADTIRFVVEDSACKAAVISPGAHPDIESIAEEAGLQPRIATEPAPTGWEDYETALAGAGPDGFEPPPIRGPAGRLPALHLGLHRASQGRAARP